MEADETYYCVFALLKSSGIFVGLFVLFVLMLYISINSFLVMLRRVPVFLGLTSTKQRTQNSASGDSRTSILARNCIVLNWLNFNDHSQDRNSCRDLPEFLSTTMGIAPKPNGAIAGILHD